jgi:Tol biopolymer transport system component/DNA-binding SARP family transcriptional activator
LIELRTLGAVDLRNGEGVELRSVLVQPKRTALLTYLAVATPRGFHRRDSLLALFWPEQDAPHARLALRQALYGLRHALGEGVVVARGDAEVGLDPAHCRCDLWAFEQALEAGNLEGAAGLYGGPFLVGFFIGGAPEFERWVEVERDRLSRRYDATLERLAQAAETQGDLTGAVRWWSRLAEQLPYTSRVTVRLMRALDAAGDRAGAILHADQHAVRLRSALDAEPDPEVMRLADDFRARPSTRTLSAAVPTPPEPGPLPVVAAADPARGQPVARLPALLVGLVLLGLAGWGLLRRDASGITTSDIRPLTSQPGIEFQPALSPDGKEVAYVAGPIGERRLAIQSTVDATGGGELRLTDSALGSAWLPRWSPDGEFVRFLVCPGTSLPYSGGCHWKETGRLGGPVRSIAVPRSAWTASWSPDGTRIAFSTHDSLFRMSLADGKATLLAVHADHSTGLHSLAWSPDSRLLAYVLGNVQWLGSGNILGSSIWVVDAAGGGPVQITRDEFLNVSPAWLDRRHLLFVSNRDGPREIYVVEVGPRGAHGTPRSVPGAADVHSISSSTAARRLVYVRLSLRQNIWAYPLGNSGLTSIRDGLPVTNGNQVIEEHDVSSDGRWLVYDSNLRGDANIYKVLLGGGAPVQLTNQTGDELGPRWSPDGTEIAYYGALREVFVIPAEGGPPTRLTNGPGSGVNPSWSPDGMKLVFVPGGLGPRALRFMTRDQVGGPWRGPFEATHVRCVPGSWTRDGTGVLCAEGGSNLTVVSPTGRVLSRRDLWATYRLRFQGYPGRYSRDGVTLYLVAAHEDGRKGIWGIPVGGGAARLVASSDDPALSFFGSLSIGPDRLYATVSQYESDVWAMRLRW